MSSTYVIKVKYNVHCTLLSYNPPVSRPIPSWCNSQCSWRSSCSSHSCHAAGLMRPPLYVITINIHLDMVPSSVSTSTTIIDWKLTKKLRSNSSHPATKPTDTPRRTRVPFHQFSSPYWSRIFHQIILPANRSTPIAIDPFLLVNWRHL